MRHEEMSAREKKPAKETCACGKGFVYVNWDQQKRCVHVKRDQQKRRVNVKRDSHSCKEIGTCEKRRGNCERGPAKETWTCGKRCVHVNRHVNEWKETSERTVPRVEEIGLKIITTATISNKVFTAVTATFEQVFPGVPKISNKVSWTQTESPSLKRQREKPGWIWRSNYLKSVSSVSVHTERERYTWNEVWTCEWNEMWTCEKRLVTEMSTCKRDLYMWNEVCTFEPKYVQMKWDPRKKCQHAERDVYMWKETNERNVYMWKEIDTCTQRCVHAFLRPAKGMCMVWGGYD